METFKDAKGREWNITLTIGSVKRVRDEVGIDILDIDALIKTVLPDDIKCAEVIAALLSKQFEAHGIDRDCMFDEDWDAATTAAATTAFIGECENFFKVRGWHERAAILKKFVETIGKAIASLTATAEAIDAAAEVQRIIASGSTSTPPQDAPG